MFFDAIAGLVQCLPFIMFFDAIAGLVQCLLFIMFLMLLLVWCSAYFS